MEIMLIDKRVFIEMVFIRNRLRIDKPLRRKYIITGTPISTVLTNIEINDIFVDSTLGISALNNGTSAVPINRAHRSDSNTSPKAILILYL